jgi:hypothetical protein
MVIDKRQPNFKESIRSGFTLVHRFLVEASEGAASCVAPGKWSVIVRSDDISLYFCRD